MLSPAATVAWGGAVVSSSRARGTNGFASATTDAAAAATGVHRQRDATSTTSVRRMRRVIAVRRAGPRGGSVAVRASGIEHLGPAISDLAAGIGLPCTVRSVYPQLLNAFFGRVGRADDTKKNE